MRKALVCISLALLAACGGKDKKATVADQPLAPLSQSKNSAVFNESFGALMEDYYHLKDNFITESDTLIRVYAKKLMKDADSLPINELRADSNVVATVKGSTGSVSAELKGLLGEKTLDAKRKSFQMVSSELYDLVRQVHYDAAVVYQQFCPMAFNNQGANWLSKTADIKNPYLPKKMLICGEVKDSIDFRGK